MADYPHAGPFGMKTIYGVSVARPQPVMVGAVHHGLALSQMGAQRSWLGSALARLGAGDVVLNLSTVPRSKPHR